MGLYYSPGIQLFESFAASAQPRRHCMDCVVQRIPKVADMPQFYPYDKVCTLTWCACRHQVETQAWRFAYPRAGPPAADNQQKENDAHWSRRRVVFVPSVSTTEGPRMYVMSWGAAKTLFGTEMRQSHSRMRPTTSSPPPPPSQCHACIRAFAHVFFFFQSSSFALAQMVVGPFSRL